MTPVIWHSNAASQSAERAMAEACGSRYHHSLALHQYSRILSNHLVLLESDESAEAAKFATPALHGFRGTMPPRWARRPHGAGSLCFHLRLHSHLRARFQFLANPPLNYFLSS
jgi:hypothetical protein